MTARLSDPTTIDPVVRGILIVTMVAVAVGVLALLRTSLGGRVDHVTVRVDNQAGVAVQVDALDASGDRVGLGEAKPRALRTFQEVPDIGARWTIVAVSAGHEVYREALARTELANRNWTITIPADAADALEQAGLP